MRQSAGPALHMGLDYSRGVVCVLTWGALGTYKVREHVRLEARRLIVRMRMRQGGSLVKLLVHTLDTSADARASAAQLDRTKPHAIRL